MQVRIMNLFFAIVIVISFYSTSFAQLTSSGVENMSKNADLILTGNDVEQNSSWNENNTRIYTQATIRVEEYIKGSNNSGLVIVSYLGGEVGDVGEMYSHMPRFENNEEVLVFLKKDDKNTNYKVVNGEEGKINVLMDPKTGEKVTTSNVQINTLKAQIKSYTKD